MSIWRLYSQSWLAACTCQLAFRAYLPKTPTGLHTRAVRGAWKELLLIRNIRPHKPHAQYAVCYVSVLILLFAANAFTHVDKYAGVRNLLERYNETSKYVAPLVRSTASQRLRTTEQKFSS